MIVLVISHDNKIAQKFVDVAMIEVKKRTFRVIQPHCSFVVEDWPIADYRFQILPGYKEK